MFKIREHSLQGVEKARRGTDRPTCNSQSQNFESVRLIDCYAAFLVLCYGFGAALILLSIEFLLKTKYFCKKYRN